MGDSQARANSTNEPIIIRSEQISHLSLLEGIYCNPYCNQADTHWYTIDKATPPDDRKPPKQAPYSDAPVQARTYASKLVAGAGVSGSSPLVGSLFCTDLQEKRVAEA
jgi:hypothetical protein